MNEEKIPPLPKLPVGEFDKKYIDQETMDQAMQFIYDHRPDFFKRSYERDKSWETDPTQDEEAWVHDAFTKDFWHFIRDVVAKEVSLPDTIIQDCVIQHARDIARVMYGMPLQRIVR
jgi:hypothetical protein